MNKLVFIAPPAAGKGTQAKLLCEKYNLTHISTGDLLRKASKNNVEIQAKLNNGEFIDDSIIISLIKDEINSIKSNGYVLDGFPRNMEQAILFDEIINNDYLVVYIDLSRDIVRDRVLGRLYCPNCGASYNEFVEENKPNIKGICDDCNSALLRRNDDTVSTFENRFDTYINCTEPLLDYYNRKQNLYTVNGNQDTMKVFSDIIQIIEGEK